MSHIARRRRLAAWIFTASVAASQMLQSSAWAEDRPPQIVALDAAEAELVGSNEAFAWLQRVWGWEGEHTPNAEARQRLHQTFEEAAKPIAGTDDLARSQARAQRLRGTALWTMAFAADPEVPGAKTFRPWLEEIAIDPDALPASYRGPFLLALAHIRAREGGDAAPILVDLLERPGVAPYLRLVAKSLQSIPAVTRGGQPADALTPAMGEVLRSSLAQFLPAQLLAADIIAGGLADPTEAWCALFDLADADHRMTLATNLAARLRAIPCDPAKARPLHLLAAWPTADAASRAVIAERVAALIDETPRNACRPLAIMALATEATSAKRYEEAISHYERVAREYPSLHVAPLMMDTAIFIRSALRKVDDNEAARTAFAEALAFAMKTFPAAQERPSWLLLASELAFERGDLATLRQCADTAPRGAEMNPVFLRAAERTVDAESMPLAERIRLVNADLGKIAQAEPAPAATTPEIAWRRSIEARAQRLGGEIEKAVATASTLVLDEAAPAEIRQRALTTILLALDEGRREVRLPTEVESLVAKSPELWWPGARPLLANWLTRLTAEPENETNRAEARRTLGALIPLFVGTAARDGNRSWRLKLADALLRSGAFAAVDQVFQGDEAHTPEALILRAEGQRRRGGDAALASAMRLFREATDASVERASTWWQAELGQLRVAATMPGTVDAVRARIHWLRSIDTALGGAATGPAIEELLRSLPDR
jgi:tetratricopeptide (TPR) repeat protein